MYKNFNTPHPQGFNENYVGKRDVFGLVVILGLSVILGAMAMIFIYMLPTEPMRDNLKKSLVIIENERNYDYEIYKKQSYNDFPHTRINSWSDSIMLMQAIYPASDSLIDDAMLNHRFLPAKTDFNTNDVLIRNLKDTSENVKLMFEETELTDGTVDVSSSSIIYPRYWHGYLIFLKPTLLFTDLSGIRLINSYFLFTLMLTAVILIYKKLGVSYAAAFFLMLLSLNPVALSISMQYDPCVYIMLISTIILLWKNQRLVEKRLFSYFFLLIGISVAFFDFLTFPLIPWLIPWLIYFALNKREIMKNFVKKFIHSGFCFGFGYAGMWFGKWILCYLLTGYNIFADVQKHILHRISNIDNAGRAITPIDAIISNIAAFAYDPLSIVIILFFVYLTVKILRKKFAIKNETLLPFIIPGILPFVWYAALSNHSYISALSTYRHLFVTLFAFLAFYIENDRKD